MYLCTLCAHVVIGKVQISCFGIFQNHDFFMMNFLHEIYSFSFLNIFVPFCHFLPPTHLTLPLF